LAALQFNPNTYGGLFGQVIVGTAGGAVRLHQLYIEMQITKADGTALTPWYLETAVVNPQATSRLSGKGMRNHLYFATAPGNTALYVAVKKNGIMTQLPAV